SPVAETEKPEAFDWSIFETGKTKASPAVDSAPADPVPAPAQPVVETPATPAAGFDFSSPWGPLQAPQKPESASEAPVEAAASGGEVETNDSVVFTLGELLRPIAKTAGIDLGTIPPKAKVHIPLSIIEPQMATGSVSIPVRDLAQFGEATETAAIADLNPDLFVTLPENELYHQLADLAPDLMLGADEDLDSQFSTLFGVEAQADSGLGWTDEALDDETPAEVETAAILPEAPVAEPVKVELKREIEIPGALPLDEVEEAPAPSNVPAKVTGQVFPVAPEPVAASKSPEEETGPEVVMPPAPKSSSLADPFAPLPRRKSAEKPLEPAAAMEPKALNDSRGEEDLDTDFFDDLSQFTAPEPEPTTVSPESAAAMEHEEMEIDEAASSGAFPAAESINWGFSGFASLDDLEPAERPQPPPTEPARPAKQKAKAPKVAIKVLSNSVNPPVAQEEDPHFFDELAATEGPVAESPAPEVAPEPAPVPAPEPVVTPPAQPIPPVSPAALFPTPVSAQPQSPAAASDLGLRDIELRAVFGTNEPFTFRRVADLTAALPGIMACAIIAPGCTAQAPRGRESGDLALQAGALLNGVREIARATGMPNAETFTLHTDQGLISVFLSGDHCLTVRHEVGQFDPGVREKLILVARGLSGLEG
ncbi:MAG: hypothetical protein KDM63_09455, partial [Verrucomicrobiae bacterium]|nr:hypothetical protein [Verrucomicrobiae bacterium]